MMIMMKMVMMKMVVIVIIMIVILIRRANEDEDEDGGDNVYDDLFCFSYFLISCVDINECFELEEPCKEGQVWRWRKKQNRNKILMFCKEKKLRHKN